MRTLFLAAMIVGAPLLAAQTLQPDDTLPVGPARVLVDLFSPAQAIRVVDLPVGTTDACTLFKSLDETLDGKPYVPRHCWFSDDFEGGYSEDWDFIPTGHVYDVSVEYTVEWGSAGTKAFRTQPVRVARVRYER